MRASYAWSLAAAGTLAAAGPAPVALTGSEWLGVDGNWSSIAFRVGQPSQNLNLLVSTALSEIWVIGSGGCANNDPTCTNARGGVFEPDASSHWSAIGTWQLPLNYPGYKANGEYGKDKVSTHSSITKNDLPLDNVLVSAINTTDYFNGYFGLGITEGNFSDKVEEPPLVQAVKSFGRIPSYTYGYTAGAYYLDQPASLTLGGYDGSRFVNHSTTFVLSQSDDQPHALVRGISLAANSSDDVPDSWESQEIGASSWNDSFTALIDSTTPYLWLPESACEQLAENLNLTYDDTFDLYTLSNEKYLEYSQEDSLSLTFSLSSMDNRDDFGDPLNAPGVVNISIPLRAFVGTLQYPFMGGESIEYGDPAVPYFTLRKAPNDSTYVIGRSFLQEAYIITRYDQRDFSVHQARFPDEPVNGAKIQSVVQGGNSPYPAPSSSGRKGLSTGAIVGIAIGSVSALVLALAVAWLCCIRRRKSRSPSPADSIDEAKEENANMSPGPSTSLFSKLWRRLRGVPQEKTVASEKGPEQGPAEVADCQIYELPAPVPPAELNGVDDSELTGDTHLGLDDDENLSAYEQARRKLNRQLQGPVPAYSPPQNGVLPPPEKEIHDLPPPQTVHTSEQMLPISPATGGTNSNSLPNSLPSPISPKTDSNGDSTGVVSPLATEAPPFPPFSAGGSNNSLPVSPLNSSSQGRSNGQNSSQPNSDTNSPISPPSIDFAQQPRPVQRTPIDPSKVVFLGNLPEHVTFPRRTSLPRINLDGLNASSSGEHQRTQQSDTLGSNYTEEQERLADMARGDHAVADSSSAPRPRQDAAGSNSDPSTPHSQERIDAGAELVHVPQLAERRYSWEDSL
ncbi:eukaryotic aspartyl protease domain-containing protein [Sarocladium implicatum]|nr:eukaryotic aspartyl protease domain-containing protein [Sarocladium implicatum]